MAPIFRSPMRPALLFAVIAVALGGAAARAQELPLSGPGLHYCPPPRQPSCTAIEATFASEAALAACSLQFNRYVDSVFFYRACLDRETKRAVAEANTASALFKCRTAGRRKCR